MILHDLPPGTTLFRAHTRQWASRPTSGAGAAAKGGRFNREGIEALYLSLEEVTALREYQQTSPFLSPCTMSQSGERRRHQCRRVRGSTQGRQFRRGQ